MPLVDAHPASRLGHPMRCVPGVLAISCVLDSMTIRHGWPCEVSHGVKVALPLQGCTGLTLCSLVCSFSTSLHLLRSSSSCSVTPLASSFSFQLDDRSCMLQSLGSVLVQPGEQESPESPLKGIGILCPTRQASVLR